MDPYSFGIAIAAQVLAALALLLQHLRTKAERETTEKHRIEDHEQRRREGRLTMFREFLQHTHAVRATIGAMMAAHALEGLEPDSPRWKQSIEEGQRAKQAMQRSFDELCLLDNDRVSNACLGVVSLIQPGLDLAKRPGGIDNAAVAVWESEMNKREGGLRDVLRDEMCRHEARD